MKKQTRKVVESASSESDDESSEGELVIGDGNNDNGTNFKQEAGQKKKPTSNMIHLHFQQRTTRKCWTIIQGLPDDLDFKKILRHFKKCFVCNGSTQESEEQGNILQLQGDHRREIYKFLCEEGIATKDTIKIHGY